VKANWRVGGWRLGGTYEEEEGEDYCPGEEGGYHGECVFVMLRNGG